MIADLFFSLFITALFMLLAWQIFSLGYEFGESAGRKAANAEKTKPSLDK